LGEAASKQSNQRTANKEKGPSRRRPPLRAATTQKPPAWTWTRTGTNTLKLQLQLQSRTGQRRASRCLLRALPAAEPDKHSEQLEQSGGSKNSMGGDGVSE